MKGKYVQLETKLKMQEMKNMAMHSNPEISLVAGFQNQEQMLA